MASLASCSEPNPKSSSLVDDAMCCVASQRARPFRSFTAARSASAAFSGVAPSASMRGSSMQAPK